MSPVLAMEKAHREKVFHDEWAKNLDFSSLKVRESFEACTAVENRYVLNQMGDLRHKKVLDLGCGAGETAVYFALRGAEVQACDISGEFLKVAGRLAAHHGVGISTMQCDTARIPCPDESFDFVFGNGVLHHVDLMTTGREIRRVLKPGGQAMFIEPLPYNPVIEVYRRLAEPVRTPDEKPLSFKKIHQLDPLFSRFRHREFWFFSLFIFLHFFFIRRWHPGKVRYWKKVIESASEYERMFRFLQKLDDWTLQFFPFLRPLCWNTVLIWQK